MPGAIGTRATSLVIRYSGVQQSPACPPRVPLVNKPEVVFTPQISSGDITEGPLRTFTRTAGSGWNTAYVVSLEAYANVAFDFQIGGGIMVAGFTTTATPTAITDYIHTFYFDGANVWTYDGSTVTPTSGVAASLLRIEREGTALRFKVNGTTELTKTIGGATPLYWAFMPNDLGAVASNVTVSAIATAAAYSLPADVGVYTLTGTATGLRTARKLAEAVGSYSLTGTATGLRIARRLTLVPGAYAVTGTATVLRTTRKLTEVVGSYAITGTATALRTARRLAEAVGSYSLTGVSTGLASGRRISAVPGSYGLSGTAATLTYTPASAGLSLIAAPGAYVLTGSDVALRIARKLQAASGQYTISGFPVQLIYIPIWTPSDNQAADYTADEPEAGTWTVVPPPVPDFVNIDQATATWTDQTPGTWQ